MSKTGWRALIRRGQLARIGGIFGLLLMAGSALAHHSYSMFDRSKEVLIKGTVKEFDYSNPHAWIYLVSADDKGQLVEWSLECRSTAELTRQGLRSIDIQPGDKLQVVINTATNGSRYGSVVRAVTANGKHFGRSTEEAEKPI